jgi:dTDP-glucose 4,6-dehydratase
LDILTIAKKVLNILEKPESLIEYIEDRPGQVSRHISSTNKANQLLGWTAKTKLDDGLKRTVDFYKNNKQWWEKFLWMKELWGQR